MLPRLVLDLGRAGIRGADEDEDPGAGCYERLQGVAAEEGAGGEGVDAEAGHQAVRRRRLAHERLGVRLGADGHVAALAVRDDEEPGLLAALTVCARAAQPGAPSRSKQASCGLTA